MCPCPGCDTSEPKELLAIPPIICSHTNRPAYSQYCETKECPVKTNAIPSIECDSDNSCPVCLSQPNDRNRSRLSACKGENTPVPFNSSQSPSRTDPKQCRQE
ncbi:jg23619 [Pararge aegeria aegeria]|uniref:Jg23619 protein n=1 Tax=Pararge aegeria aegeria TaxID=348720 RepID=A0A8S4SDK3_9NEOP|nr:jg23619 [Pararge aegeria aegeria]